MTCYNRNIWSNFLFKARQISIGRNLIDHFLCLWRNSWFCFKQRCFEFCFPLWHISNLLIYYLIISNHKLTSHGINTDHKLINNKRWEGCKRQSISYLCTRQLFSVLLLEWLWPEGYRAIWRNWKKTQWRKSFSTPRKQKHKLKSIRRYTDLNLKMVYLKIKNKKSEKRMVRLKYYRLQTKTMLRRLTNSLKRKEHNISQKSSLPWNNWKWRSNPWKK